MKNKKITELFIVLITIFMLLNQVEASYDSNISTIATSDLVASDPIDITSDQDFIDLGFSGSGTKEDPYIIENYEINGTTSQDGIHVEDTTKYFIIRGCKIRGAYQGIGIENVSYETAQIINNYCYLNDKNAIDLYNTSGHLIKNNTVIENKMGIRFDWCDNLTIIENTIYKNRGCGMVTFNANNLDIRNNRFIYSDYEGIVCETTNSSVISKNLFKFNDEFGVGLTTRCADNIIYHNDFIYNNRDPTVPEGTSQGEDRASGLNNLWYNSALQEGNHWSDWIGEGTYQIDGSAYNEDLYPLSDPISGLEYEEGGELEDDPTDEETNYSLLFILAFLASAFVVFKRKRTN